MRRPFDTVHYTVRENEKSRYLGTHNGYMTLLERLTYSKQPILRIHAYSTIAKPDPLHSLNSRNEIELLQHATSQYQPNSITLCIDSPKADP